MIRKSLLLVAYYYPPQLTSGAARPARWAKYLRRTGWDVRIVTSHPVLPEEAIHGLSVSPANLTFKGRLCGLIQRWALPFDEKLGWSMSATEGTANWLRSDQWRPSAVLSTSPPLGGHLTGFMLARRLAVPWVADFRDPLVGNPFRNRSWVFRYDSFIEHQIVKQANCIILNTDSAHEQFCEGYQNLKHKFHFLWNGFDPDDVILKPGPSFDMHCTVSHVGALYGARHPGAFLASIKRLIKSGRFTPRELKIQLIGDVGPGVRDQGAQDWNYLADCGVLDDSFGRVTPDCANHLMRTSDVLLLLDLNETGSNLQLPAKIFDYVRASKVIIAWTSKDSPTERLLRRSGVSHQICYPTDADEDLDKKVLAGILASTEPQEPDSLFLEEFDAKCQTAKLEAWLSDLSRCRDL